MDEHRIVPLIDRSGSRTLVSVRVRTDLPGDDAAQVELTFSGRKFSGRSTEGCFDALRLLRIELERHGMRLACLGAAANVHPSPMIVSMGDAVLAYRLTLGRHARLSDLVGIFDVDESAPPASVAEQDKFYREWIASLR